MLDDARVRTRVRTLARHAPSRVGARRARMAKAPHRESHLLDGVPPAPHVRVDHQAEGGARLQPAVSVKELALVRVQHAQAKRLCEQQLNVAERHPACGDSRVAAARLHELYGKVPAVVGAKRLVAVRKQRAFRCLEQHAHCVALLERLRGHADIVHAQRHALEEALLASCARERDRRAKHRQQGLPRTRGDGTHERGAHAIPRFLPSMRFLACSQYTALSSMALISALRLRISASRTESS